MRGGADSSPSARGLEARAPRVRNDNRCGGVGLSFAGRFFWRSLFAGGGFWQAAAKGTYLRPWHAGLRQGNEGINVSPTHVSRTSADNFARPQKRDGLCAPPKNGRLRCREGRRC